MAGMNEAKAREVEAGFRIERAGIGTGSQRLSISGARPEDGAAVEEEDEAVGPTRVARGTAGPEESVATTGLAPPEEARYADPGLRSGTSFHRLILDELATAVKT